MLFRSHLTTARERYAGFVEEMAAQGASVSPEWVQGDAITAEDGYAVATRILAGAERPTAFFSAQNLITMGVFRALRDRGLQHSIALVGFDDFQLADLLDPGVTVVAQDPRAMGQRAAEILFQRMDRDDEAPDEPQTYVIPSRLITRGSGEIRPE